MKAITTLLVAVCLCPVADLEAQRLIAQWNFNNPALATPSTGAGEYRSTGGVASEFLAGSPTDPASGPNLGLSLSGFPPQGTAPQTAGVDFNVDTTGYTNLVLSFDLMVDANASSQVLVQYTANGVDYTDAGGSTLNRADWFSQFSFGFRGRPGAENNPKFGIRIVSDFFYDEEHPEVQAYRPVSDVATYAPAGRWRFDLVSLYGTPIDAIPTNIAYLRSLVNPADGRPTDVATRYTVEGIVTTHVNLAAPPNAWFFIQDSTAGIAVLVEGGTGAMPAAGDLVRVTAPLAHVEGLLVMKLTTGQTGHGWTVLSSGHALPTPRALDFSWENQWPAVDAYEGSYVVASNVRLDLTQPNFPAPNGGDVTLTNEAGATFTLRVNAQTDIGGQPKPTVPVTILGVLSQADPSRPHTSSFQLLPSRLADIFVGPPPPEVKGLAVTLGPAGAVTLTWQPQAGRTYTVWKADAVTGPYGALAAGLPGPSYEDHSLATAAARFYRVSTP